MMKNKFGYYCFTVICSLVAILYVFVLIRVYNEDFLRLRGIGMTRNAVHSYFGYCVGIGAYLMFLSTLIFPKIRHNVTWFMKFTHELTHTLVALLFFAKIQEFVVKERRCSVRYEANRFAYVPITLAPYCIPIYTFMLFPFRFFGSGSYMFVFDILIAFSYAFHVHSFIKYTRPYQFDIEECGLGRSAAYISAVHLIVLSLIMAIPPGGVVKALIRVFATYPYDVVRELIAFL